MVEQLIHRIMANQKNFERALNSKIDRKFKKMSNIIQQNQEYINRLRNKNRRQADFQRLPKLNIAADGKVIKIFYLLLFNLFSSLHDCKS